MNIKCTQCGGDVPIEQDSGFVVCPYCGSSLFVELDQTVRHYALRPIVPAQNLGPTIQRGLAEMELKNPLQVQQARFLYFPFWRLHTAQGRQVIITAATTVIEGLAEVTVPSGELRFFDPQLAADNEVIEPETLLEGALAQAAGLGLPDQLTRADLIHMPMYFVDYQYQGRTYHAVVDAVSGKVYADEFPPSPSREKDRLFAGMMLLTFALFFIEGIAVPGFGLTMLAYVATSSGLYLLIKRLLQRKGW